MTKPDTMPPPHCHLDRIRAARQLDDIKRQWRRLSPDGKLQLWRFIQELLEKQSVGPSPTRRSPTRTRGR